MPFIDQSDKFVRGFECGQIWVMAQEGKDFKEYPFHSVNAGQIKMTLKLHGYEHTIEILDEPWSILSGSNNANLN